MDIKEIIQTMAEGNFGAAFSIKEMLNYPSGILDILLCDTLEIRGTKLYMLYSDCCGRNCGKLKLHLICSIVKSFQKKKSKQT